MKRITPESVVRRAIRQGREQRHLQWRVDRARKLKDKHIYFNGQWLEKLLAEQALTLWKGQHDNKPSTE